MMQQLTATEEEKQQAMKDLQKSQLSLLRNDITQLYFEYLESKIVPAYKRKDMVSLFESYEKLGGNSYVKTIYEEFMDWQVKT